MPIKAYQTGPTAYQNGPTAYGPNTSNLAPNTDRSMEQKPPASVPLPRELWNFDPWRLRESPASSDS